MKELIERLRLITKKLRLTPMPIADVIPALQDSANALERMEADNTELQAALDGAKLFEQSHKHALTVIERLTAELNSIKEKNAPEIVRINAYITELTAERDAYKGMYEAAHAMRGDAEVEALKAEAENAALRADAELKYTAWQSPHNDDLWLEHPADCEIIDNFHPPVHVGFEYELTAGSYTTQRYRVVKIADAESDDVLVELIAGEKT